VFSFKCRVPCGRLQVSTLQRDLSVTGATKHRIGYIGCIGHIGVQIMLLLDMTQYKW